MQILFRVGIELCSYTCTPLTDDLAFSTSMSYYRSTTGTGGLSQKSSTFAILHSESHLAEAEYVSKC